MSAVLEEAPSVALEYLRTIFKPGDFIDIKYIHQMRTYIDDKGNKRAEIREHFRALESVADLIQEFDAAQAEGWNIYVCMNPLKAERDKFDGKFHRRKRDVAVIRTVYVEFDENGAMGLARVNTDIADGTLPDYDYLLESSPGKFYIIWTVEDFTPQQQEALNKALQLRYGSDPASVDCVRVLRIPGTRNLKPRYSPTPVVTIKDSSAGDRSTPKDFDIPYAVPAYAKSGPVDNAAIQARVELVKSNLDLAGIAYEVKNLLDEAGYIQFDVDCPWKASHTTAGDVAAVFVRHDSLGFHCFHAHCAERHWKPDFREYVQGKATASGHAMNLSWGEAPEEVILSLSAVPASSSLSNSETGEFDPVPPFDPSVINGIYKKFVDVATRGTTLAPQFVYCIAKNIVGAKMAGKVRFENLNVEPRFYTALIGETGSGKGEAWRRVFQILNVEGQIGNVAGIKIVNSADSGAGIRDAFFEPPEGAPLLIYIDEVESFGNKAAATRNPAILDTLIELADSTQISRVKASSKNQRANRTKNDARLCAVMCGQEGSVYMKAFAGRTKLGLWDRLSPEYGSPVEAGDLPPISTSAAYALLLELNKLDYSGTMSMSVEAKTSAEAFWSKQEAGVRKKARWRKNFVLDAYMSAFGRGSKIAESEDVDVAIKIFVRQLAIRAAHFTSEVPDRIGYYLGLLKSITAKMERRLVAGEPEFAVAKSRRDYEKETHAHRDNEMHIFERAWHVYSPTWLEKREVKKTNGQTYMKFVPATDE